MSINLNTIILRKGECNMPTKDFKGTYEKGNAVFGVDNDAVELMRWNISQKDEAMKKLAEYTCSYQSISGTTWIEEYALEFCECDEDGDFVQGSDFEIAAGPEPGKTYYLPDDDIWETFFGNQNPICVDEAEVRRLAREWGEDDLMEKMHEAAYSDLEDYGWYNS